MKLCPRIFSISTALAFSIFTSNSHAFLIDRGNGMIYDSEQNITWLQDASYAKTSGYDDDGRMTWSESLTWTENLVYEGFNDWRLPSANLIGNSNTSYDGSTDYGFNNTRSEVGHLYAELGNIFYCSISQVCPQDGYGFNKTTFVDAASGQDVAFLNIQNFAFWEAEEFAPQPIFAWAFDSQLGGYHWGDGKNFVESAWAVRDGDVATAQVPEPAAIWLVGAGLLGVTFVSRRKKLTA